MQSELFEVPISVCEKKTIYIYTICDTDVVANGRGVYTRNDNGLLFFIYKFCFQ